MFEELSFFTGPWNNDPSGTVRDLGRGHNLVKYRGWGHSIIKDKHYVKVHFGLFRSHTGICFVTGLIRSKCGCGGKVLRAHWSCIVRSMLKEDNCKRTFMMSHLIITSSLVGASDFIACSKVRLWASLFLFFCLFWASFNSIAHNHFFFNLLTYNWHTTLY